MPYPLIGSAKIDGIRCLIHPTLGPVTRSLKPIRNAYIRRALAEEHFIGLDGELVVGNITAPDVFQKTTSGVMTQGGEPDFKYWVFDDFTLGGDPYDKRITYVPVSPFIEMLPSLIVHSSKEVLGYEVRCLEVGYEGIMLRRPNGPYKFGRSTLKEGILLKLKRFKDAEATIVGFEEKVRNENEAVRDSLGYQRRSSHLSGKALAGTLGALLVDGGSLGYFAIGSGFDQALRDEIWTQKALYLGRRISFKYQQVGIKTLPRFPIFRGFREEGT